MGGWFHCKRCCMCLLCRLICPLIHRCSSTSSVLTCPPPKDPLHTSCPAPPAPRRRPPASCPSFSNHPPSPPLSFVRRDLLYIFPPFFVAFVVPFDLFTLAFRRQGLRFYPRHPQPQAIIHILCRQVQCTLVPHLHNGLSPACLRLLAQKCVILNTWPKLTGVIIGLCVGLYGVNISEAS